QTLCPQARFPIGYIALDELGRKEGDESLAVGDAGGIRREPRVGGPFGVPQARAELSKLAVVADRQGEGAVPRWEDLIGDDAGVGVAEAAGPDARGEISGGDVHQRGEPRLEERHVDVLAVPGRV